jgi:6-phosphogluconolactonase
MQRSFRLSYFLDLFLCLAIAAALAVTIGCGTIGHSNNPSSPGGPGGANPQSAARFVFALVATQIGNSGVAAFTFNPGTGALAMISGSPFSTSPFATAMAATPQTRFVYVGDVKNQNIIEYRADNNSGALTQMTTLATPGIGFPSFMLVSPNGQTLYVADSQNSKVWAFSIGADGSLSQFAASTGMPWTTTEPVSQLTMNAAGTLLFAIGQDQVFAFTVGAGGVLTPAGNTVVRAPSGGPGKGPFGIVGQVDQAGRFLFIGDQSNQQLFVYSVASNGRLTPVAGSPFPDQLIAGAVAVTPNGQFVYVAGFGTAQVAAFSVNQSTGAVTPVAGSPFDNGPFRNGGAPISDAHVDPTGRFLLLADEDQGRITVFAIDSASGVLANVSGSPFVAAQPGGGSPSVLQLTQ